MKIAFEKQCQCPDLSAVYPIPHIATRAPKPTDPLAYVEISFSCAMCGKLWRDFSADNFAEARGPEVAKLITIDGKPLASEAKG